MRDEREKGGGEREERAMEEEIRLPRGKKRSPQFSAFQLHIDLQC
jgi:hypothetical protein